MKYDLIACLLVGLFLSLDSTTATAQSSPERSRTYGLPKEPASAALAKHDLAWIKTGNDFDQRGLTGDQIDGEIERRIKAYGREADIIAFDIPINAKKLTFAGKKYYKDFSPVLTELNVTSKLRNTLAFFWTYGDISIATLTDAFKDQLNVYSICRGIEILKYRYPLAYRKLYAETRHILKPDPSIEGDILREYYRTILFSFDWIPNSIAASVQAYGDNEDKTGKIGTWPYTALISIDFIGVQGESLYGSRPIYKKSAADENYMCYLREGLVETMVHEMLHRYMAVRKGYENEAHEVFHERTDSNIEPRLNNMWEEVYIINTSLSYFRRQGGLRSDLYKYYEVVMTDEIKDLNDAKAHGEKTNIDSAGALQGKSDIGTMRLSILD